MTTPASLFAPLPALPFGQQWVVSLDTLVEDVHFSAHTPLDELGYKCVAVNLSDMAAMGATPRSVQCAFSDPGNDPSWQQALQQAIKLAAAAESIPAQLAKVTAPRRQVSIQIIGEVPAGDALTRDGARSGEQLWVSGTLGDAGAGLALFEGRLQALRDADRDYLLRRFHHPLPRLALGRALRGIASAAIDISDGIAGDAAHLAERSKVGLRIHAQRLPLSGALRRVAGELHAQQLALGAGEDYELAFSAAVDRAADVQQAARLCHLPVHCIGEVIAGNAVQLLDANLQELRMPPAFDHFVQHDAIHHKDTAR